MNNALLEEYIRLHSSSEDDVLSTLYRDTHIKILQPHMCSGSIQGQFLSLLTKISGAKNVLEIGTFTGYASICFAKSLADGGFVDTIDINKELVDFCEPYFRKAQVQDKINMYIGPAIDIIDSLSREYDIVFIDADKQNYALYYDKVFDKVRSGGLIIADNVLWKGEVVHEQKSKDCEAMHQYNIKVKADPRVEPFILSLRDGLNIARKK